MIAFRGWHIVSFVAMSDQCANAENRDFTDDIGKDVVEGMMEGLSDEDKQYAFASSLRFVMAAGFHKPGIVYTVCWSSWPSLRILLECWTVSSD
jgi:hypothetical protein